MVEIYTRRRKGPQMTAPPPPPAEQATVSRVDAVLCSDLHYRPDTPLCRTDDYQAAQARKLEFISALCQEHNAPLLSGGDLGDASQWPNWLLERFMALADGVRIYGALGQHDLPGHSLKHAARSGCGVLMRAGILHTDYCMLPLGGRRLGFPVYTAHWGEELPEVPDAPSPAVLITHRMVINGKTDWPGQKATQAHALLDTCPWATLVLSGDNHKPFCVRNAAGQLLVNPGSMMRMDADQVDHRPCVYLWDAVANEVAPVYLPIEVGVVDRTHIQVAAQRDERIQAFFERMKNEASAEGITLSFEANMETELAANPVEEAVVVKVWETIEEAKK